MVEEKGTGDVTARYDGYVADLRDLLRSRSVPFGNPEDLVPFAARVSVPGSLGDEVGSLLRSFLYAEAEHLSREDLLMLLTLAVGESPLEPEMPGLETALRQLFRFVTEAIHQHGRSFAPEGDEETTGEGSPAVTETWEAGREEVSAENAARPVGGPAPMASGVLFRAVSMAAEHGGEAGDKLELPTLEPLKAAQRPAAEPPPAAAEAPPGAAEALRTKPRPSPRATLALSAAAFAAAAGVLLYLFWPAGMHLAGSRRIGPGAPIPAAVQGPTTAQTCVPPLGSGVSRVAVEERSLVAHDLMDQGMYGAALQQVRAVAQADPGFPGVYLDESNALLQMKLPEQARAAIDAQIRVSECLAALPSAALDAYCASQFSASTVSACRPQLAHVRQAAQLQAALVHLELGHSMDGDNGAAALKQLQADDAVDSTPKRAARAVRTKP